MTDQDKITLIKTYLTAHPELDGADPNTVSISLNAKDPLLSTQVRVDVTSSTVRAIFLGSLAPNTQSSSWSRIKRCSEGRLDGLPSDSKITIEDLCNTVYDACALQETLEPARFDAIDQALTVMVETGFISTDTKNSLDALSWQTVENSWADINVEGRFISGDDITAARAE